jgi:hypothetical protein
MRRQDYGIPEALTTYFNVTLSYMNVSAQFVLLDCDLKVVIFLGDALPVQIGSLHLPAHVLATIKQVFWV